MKKFGIRVTLPTGDPLRGEHLLGEEWSGQRWFDTEQDRDKAYQEMLSQPPYYRNGDIPSQILEKIAK